MISNVLDNPEPLKALEREMIRQVLHETQWKYNECARKLKVSRTTLWRKMKELGLRKE